MGTAIAQGGDLRVKRELIEHLEVVLCRDLVDVAFAVDLERLTAARALDIAVIFDETEHGHVHHFRHFDRFGDDHGDELLRGGNDDDAVKRDGLEHRERCVAGSGGQVNKHIIDFIPDDVAPELLDDTGDDPGRAQTTGEVSSGRSSLMLMVSMPVFVLTGNRPSSLPMAFSWMPKHFGIDGPVMSASRMAVLKPRRCMVTASIEVTRLLPTPPLPLHNADDLFDILILFWAARKLSGFWREGHSSPQLEQSCVQFSAHC